MTAILFQSSIPVLWVTIGSLLVLTFLGWLEIRRKQKLLSLRLLAVSAAVLSLACLLVRPVQSLKKSADIIVLTEGYSKNIIDSLLKKNPESQLYTYKTGSGFYDAKEINNYRNLLDLTGNLSFIGQGVPEYALDYIDTSSLQFYPSRLSEGFIAVDQKEIYKVNQLSRLQGTFYSGGKVYLLKLSVSGITQDSSIVKSGKADGFSLKFTPKAPGLYLYQLTATDSSGKITFSEDVPVQVAAQKPLSLLFLCDYPSAEIRFLKNFLETRNHAVTLRYKISKDRFRAEFINTSQKNIKKITLALLQNYDLVITDATSLPSLSEDELRELKKAIQSGLGIITMLDTPIPAPKATKFLDLSLTKIKVDSAQLFINNKKLKIQATPVTLTSERKLFSVLREPSGRMVSGYYSYGLGKSGFQLLTNTFRIQLSGEKEIYAELWAELLEQVARKETKKYDIILTTPFPYYEDHPVEFKILAAAEKPTIRIDSVEIQLAENPVVKNIWYGKIWAGNTGWHELSIDQDTSTYNFFVARDGQWSRVQLANQQAALKRLSGIGDKSFAQSLHKPVSPIIFYILFLVAAGFLWLAPKI